MLKIQADYVFPIHTSPVKNGVVVVDDDGSIVEVAEDGVYSPDEIRRVSGVVCPGFVNAHCHIELSHLKGVIPEHTGLINFLKPIGSLREAYSIEVIMQQITLAEQEMLQNGIVAVGDIANTAHSLEQKGKGNLYYHTFVEIFGLNAQRTEASMQSGRALHALFSAQPRHLCSLAPHAPYSASGSLIGQIAAFNNQTVSGILSIHNQECLAEDEFFRFGTGEFVDFYQAIGLGNTAHFFTPPGVSSVSYIAQYAAQAAKLMLVHNTFTTPDDIARTQKVVEGELYWCFCPNANLYIENQLPNFDVFIKQKATIVVGTDSLTSNRQLCILSELKTITQHAPHIPLEQLFTWATLNGAKALGFSHVLGTLAVGKRPGLVCIEEVNLHTLQLTPQSRAVRLV